MCTIECNQKCSKCSHWKHKDSSPRLDPLLVSQAAKNIAGIRDLTIVGGEPLLFKDEIRQIVADLENTQIRTVIITNAAALSSDFADFMAGRNVHFVFSIDTVDRKFWRFVRGLDSYDTVMRNLDYAFKTLGRKQMSVQSVLSAETERYIPAVRDFAAAHGLYHGVQDFVSEGFEGSWTPLAKKAAPQFPQNEQQCFAAGRNVSIMQNGDVFTCFQQSQIEGFEKPLGNLNDSGIEKMLASEYAKSVQCAMRKCNKSCKVLKCNIQR